MHAIEAIVALVVVSATLAGLARALGVHYAIVLVLGGLVLGFVPGVPDPRLEPGLVLFVFLPPLIYAAAYGSSPQDLWKQARAISTLAIGLVLATVCGVAAIAHLVAGIGWAPAMVLGAILAPTDPIAATSVLRRLGAPERMSRILEGEALVNDGTGLTIYTLAVGAVLTGHFSLASGVLQFVVSSAGGVAIGLAAGWVSSAVRRRIDEPAIEISISLLTAYVAYLPAERLGVSGILAVVAAGLFTSHQAESLLSASSRLQLRSFWDVLSFLLESVLFLLIGLQLKGIVGDLSGGPGKPLAYAAAVLAGLVLIRIAWLFAASALLRLASLRRPGQPTAASRAELLVMGWSGMRGGLSLAAALALPLSAAGHLFANRDTLIFVSYVVIAATIVIPGLTITVLVRRLGLAEDEAVVRAESDARVALAQAALKHIDEVAERHQLHERIADQLRMNYTLRIQRLNPEANGSGGRAASARARQARSLQRELIGIERKRLAQLRRQGLISLQSQRRIERDLDLEESRLRR
jgi:CPA1 family monovalent cation:H+ antiporter